MPDLLRDRYEPLRQASTGGEATVFKARDHLHDRFVALKVRSADKGVDRAQLVAEAGILLSLDPHPRLPTVRDDFFVDDRYVIVMDWVDGVDLDHLLARHGRPGLPLTTVLSYLAQVAEALTHLHSHDPPVVHGDVKPANLILNEQGRITVVDFGLSSRGPGRDRAGYGTTKFVAPEIAAGLRPERASDVYSLAATAHALLTGTPPTGVPMDLGDMDATAALAVNEAIHLGLALDPGNRPASAGEFVERLRSGWQSTLPTGVTTFLLTDVVGSTSLWEANPAAMSVALVRHDALVIEAVEQAGGRLIKSMGEGDSTVSVFARADDGVRAALAANAALSREPWPEGAVIRIRAALHTGLAELRDAQYFGPTLNRTARLRSLAEAGEVLVSSVVAELVGPRLPPDCSLIDLGVHGLPGLGKPELVHAVLSPSTETPPLAVCPYRGLSRYETSDAALFFGRRAAAATAVERLAAHPFLAVIGASGSGKSSLVEAGVLPAIVAGADPGEWRVEVISPGITRDIVDHRWDPANGDTRRLIVVDPLEHLFTQWSDPSARAAFVRQVLSVADMVIVVLRADFYGECAAIPELAEAVSEHQLLLGPMSDDELRDAIEQPAAVSRLLVEAGLTELLVDDVAGEPGALPLLSHALVETWARRNGRTLTIAGYRAAGGVRGAMARTADATYEAFDRHSQDLVRKVFLRLVEPGEGTQDTRRKAPITELQSAAGGDDVHTVLEELAGARLVSIDTDGVEVAHETLIREWPRLRGWLDEDRDDVRAYRHLTRSADAWVGAARDPAELYRGARLVSAERLDRQTVSELEAEFLDASRHASEREQETLREQVAQQNRANRRLRRVLAGLGVALLLAILSASVALVQRGRADHEADLARAANRLSSEQLARGLASSALQLAETNPYLATVLATEAIARFNPVLPEARSALVESRIRLAGRDLVPYGDPISVGDALNLAMRPGTDTVAVCNRDGTIDVWDLGTRRRVEQLTGPAGGVQRVMFTPDGKWLLAGSDDGRLWRWSADRPTGAGATREGRVLVDTGAVVWSVAAAPAGDLVAAVTQAGDLFLVDAESGAAMGEPLHAVDPLMSVTFSPDGGAVTAGSLRGGLYAWSMATRAYLFEPIQAHGSLIWDVEVTAGPDPAIISSASEGSVKLWDLGTGQPLPGPGDATPPLLGSGTWGVALSREGDVVWLGGRDGSVYAWSRSAGTLDRTAPAHRGEIRAVAGSPDTFLLASLGEDRTLQVWTDRPRAAPVTTLAREATPPTALAVSPNGRMLAVASKGGLVRLIEAMTGDAIGQLDVDAGHATALAFATGSQLIVGTSEGALTLWDVRSGQRPRLLVERALAPGVAVGALAISPGTTDPMLVTTGSDGYVRRWDAQTLDAIGRPSAKSSAAFTDIAFAPGGASFAAATQQGTVTRWSATGEPLETFTVTDDVVWSIAFGFGGTLGAVSADEVLTLWSPSNDRLSKRVHTLGPNRGGALDVAFLDAGTVVASAGDGRAQLWDVDSGTPLGSALRVTESAARFLAAAGDGTFWVASDDGTISRVDALLVDAACDIAAASFDDQQRSRLLAGRPQLGCQS